ncbi:hypothetical protein KY345_06280 [Candidatus Woesearchaeota archaeon]|nr:hypothetical protein [Candidatus Woesearchaeota archaeon]
MNSIIVEDGRGKKLLLFDEDIEICCEDDIYNEEMAEDFSDNDEISSAEEGFIKGYLAA